MILLFTLLSFRWTVPLKSQFELSNAYMYTFGLTRHAYVVNVYSAQCASISFKKIEIEIIGNVSLIIEKIKDFMTTERNIQTFC